MSAMNLRSREIMTPGSGAIMSQHWAKCSQACAAITKQYNLGPAYD